LHGTLLPHFRAIRGVHGTGASSTQLQYDLKRLRPGVNLHARELIEGKWRNVYNWLTWGQHDSSNEYRHCRTVICVGIMNLDRLVIHALALGQLRSGSAHGSGVGSGGDTSTTISAKEVTAIQQSECAHLLYQATSRAQCRVVDGDLARPTAVYFVHKSHDIHEYLRVVTPGAKVVEWERPHRSRKPTQVSLAAERIAAVLAFRTTPISTKALRRVAGLDGGIPTRLYSRALDRALERLLGRWTKDGRMLVPTTAHVTARGDDQLSFAAGATAHIAARGDDQLVEQQPEA
ncbi:MAG: hypothetical protein L0Y66_25485, partial [Myxococcaceae bacterium]|nr:hypothetical protein [Myxococcaceae bacterium]